MKKIQTHYVCPTCDYDFMLTVTRPLEAVGEMPPEVSEYSPDVCPECGEDIIEDSVKEWVWLTHDATVDAEYEKWLDRWLFS